MCFVAVVLERFRDCFIFSTESRWGSNSAPCGFLASLCALNEVLICIFYDQQYLAFFHVPVSHLHVFFWKNASWVFCLFFIQFFFFFKSGCMSCFYILNIIVYFGWQYHLEILFPFSRLSSHFCDGLISCSKDKS